MMYKIKSLIRTNNSKRFISNFLALASLQGVNYILPLLTLPYLVRVLGVEYFGLLAFATATTTYFGLITDYGFNLTATRQISIHRDNQEKIVEIFSSVMIVKSILLLLSFLLMTLLVFSFAKFSNDWKIYFLTFGIVIGQTFFPVWFFQGMERMKYSTYLNILSKVIFTISIFLFVKEKNDYYLVPILTSLGFIIAGLFSLYLIKKEFNITFKLQSIENIKSQFKDGWHIFLTSFQSSILASSGVFILGLFQSNEIVGYYSAVEKVAKAFVGLFAPVTQALYPLTSAKLHKSVTQGKAFVLKMGIITLSFAILTISIMLLFSKNIILLLLGGDFNGYEYILEVLSIWLFFGVLNNFIGIQYLTGLGQSRYYMKSFLIASSVALILYFSLIPLLSIYGILIGMVLSEIILTVGMLYYIRKHHL